MIRFAIVWFIGVVSGKVLLEAFPQVRSFADQLTVLIKELLSAF